ncbi:MAG TPA: hypothetical protein VGW98_07725 [Solirubrobacteraceae bacterium]|jgi:hypothetical protein|nr:hypothetical protein [Solirubrobacteraceae bacterium]
MTSKKLLLSLAPLLVAASFVVMSSAAQAAPHWRVNGVLAPAGPPGTSVLEWGVSSLYLTTASSNAEAVCQTAALGTIENPLGGAGLSATQASTVFDCEDGTPSFCAPGNTIVVASESLPWPWVLEKAGPEFKAKITGVRLVVECFSGTTEVSHEGYSYSGGAGGYYLWPTYHRRTSCNLHPSYFEGKPGTGALNSDNNNALLEVRGELKVCGYDEEELITVTEP